MEEKGQPWQYELKKSYLALLFNEWAKEEFEDNHAIPKYDIQKCCTDFDGKQIHNGSMFLVVFKLPSGPVFNYFKMKDWDLFKIPIVETVVHKFDFHSNQAIIDRLTDILNE